MKNRIFIFLSIFFLIILPVHASDFIYIDDMDDYIVFTFDKIDLSLFNGSYGIYGIINGNINMLSLGIHNISDIIINMDYNEETGNLVISSNIPHAFSQYINNREYFRTQAPIYSADGYGTSGPIAVYFSNNGIVLYCWNINRDEGINEHCNFLLERIE